MKNEIYVILKDIDSKYAISNKGNVKNINTDTIISKQISKQGYEQVGLFPNKIKKTFRIHRLVAYYFIENEFNKPYVNHIDGNKQNNNVENLEWCTAKENDTHARENGLKFAGKPLKATNIISNEEKVYMSVGEASRMLSINKAFIQRCLKKTYGKDIYKNYKFQYLEEYNSVD